MRAAAELRDPWALAVAAAAALVAYIISVPWQFALAAAVAIVAVRVVAGLLIPVAGPPQSAVPVPPSPIIDMPEHLTPKELEVAALVYEGLRNKEIAERLFVEESTVKNHVQHIRDKLGFHTRGEIAKWWAEHTLSTRK
jgi:DNA-binding NarL/FixJ family response regulator